MCVLIISTTSVWNIADSKKKWASYDKKGSYIGLHVKYPLFLSDFNELDISRQIFEKSLNVISW
jgi:methionine salvage enolase-phosphatase E1